MKTRIKVVSTAGGDILYYPQHKGLIFWSSYYYDFIDASDCIRFKTLSEAQAFVSELIEKHEAVSKAKARKQIEKAKSKIISIDYVSYNETNTR